MHRSKLTYVRPYDAGLASEPAAVGRRIGKLIDALENLDMLTESGPGTLAYEVREFRINIINKLQAEGWRCGYRGGDHYKVLIPLDYWNLSRGKRQKGVSDASTPTLD